MILRTFEGRMDFLSVENESVIIPREVVRASLSEKGVTEKALALYDLAIITLARCDLLILVEETGAQRVKIWSGGNDKPYRGIAGEGKCILTQSLFGAPNAVMLLEELAALRVKKVGTMMRLVCKSIVKQVEKLRNLQ